MQFDDFQVTSYKPVVESTVQPMENFPTLEEAVSSHIRQAMQITKGKIEGSVGLADLLKENPSTIRQKMRKLGIPFGKEVKKQY